MSNLRIKNIKVSPKVWIKDHAMPVAMQRTKQDIARWRAAIQAAESPDNPQTYLVQQMYVDTVLNGQVAACMEKRYANILKKGINVVNQNDEPDDNLTKIYNKKWMYDILRHTLDAKFYGYSLIQLGDMFNYDIEEVYILRRANVNPETEMFVSSFGSIEGIKIKDPKYYKHLIYVTTPNEVGRYANWGKCGYGLLYKIAPYEIWYRQAVTLWNKYQQLYGVPPRIGRTNTRDEQQRNQMADMLENMGSAAWGVFDLDDQIEILNGSNMTAGNDVFQNMLAAMEKVISKLILGHADAIDSIPGKLGASQGQDNAAIIAMKDIASFDSQFLEYELEKNIIPKLQGMGFKMPPGYRIKFINSDEKMEARAKEDLNNKATADLVKTLADSKLKVDPVWFTERTGIPVEVVEEQERPVLKNKFAQEIQNKLDHYYNGCTH